MPGAERVPAVQLCDDGEVAEPVGLERLVEGPRGACAGTRAQVSETSLEARRGGRGPLALRHLARERGVALGQRDDRVRDNVHRAKLLAPVLGERVGGELERIPRGSARRLVVVARFILEPGERGGHFRPEVEHAVLVDLAVGHRVAGRALLHELREDARGVRGLPVAPAEARTSGL